MIAFVGVTVLPLDTAAVLSDQIVVVRGERVGPRAEVAVPPEAQVIDGRVRYLMPRLMDLHVHLVRTRTSRPCSRSASRRCATCGARRSAAESGSVVALDLAVDDVLAREGLARELNRAVQELRKQARLAYTIPRCSEHRAAASLVYPV